MLETLLCFGVAAIAIVVARASRFVVALIAISATLLAFAWPRAREAPHGSPLVREDRSYVGSGACVACHPSEHASWSRTFHRTMTQRGTAASIVAPSMRLELDGEATIFTRDADGARAESRGVSKRIVLTTGSHHYQAYWLEGERRGDLAQLPFVYLIAEQKFIPRRDAFLQPREQPQHDVRWSSNCVQCHAVAGRPRFDDTNGHFDTDVAELGIACEACHGPGGEHVRARRDPIVRYGLHRAGAGDDTIVNPARLPADRASEVCGQCHSYAYPRDEAEWWTYGYSRAYQPGKDLSAARLLITRDGKYGVSIDATLDSVFWPDGTMRVGGREYNAMVLSPCFLQGTGDQKMSCLSCHSMHQSDPDDQLAVKARGDGACLPCHETMRGREKEHSHHQSVECASCHMPKTSYALLGSIRSHRITSPRAGSPAPNACNLCHLGENETWTSDRLFEWYGTLRADVDAVPAGIHWVLGGDAGERPIAAAALGDPIAATVTSETFRARLLAELLDDPYAAVRIVAWRSLKTTGHAPLGYDPLMPEAERTKMRFALIATLPPLAGVDVDAQLAGRDDRAIWIAE